MRVRGVGRHGFVRRERPDAVPLNLLPRIRPRLGTPVESKARSRAYKGERLEVTCWCEETVLCLPVQMIRAGLTASCGRRACHAPAAT